MIRAGSAGAGGAFSCLPLLGPWSKATLWVKAQHEGALPPPCIVRKDPRVEAIHRTNSFL